MECSPFHQALKPTSEWECTYGSVGVVDEVFDIRCCTHLLEAAIIDYVKLNGTLFTSSSISVTTTIVHHLKAQVEILKFCG